MGYATLYGELCLNPPIRGSIAYKWLVKIAEEESLNPPIRGSIAEDKTPYFCFIIQYQSPYKGFNRRRASTTIISMITSINPPIRGSIDENAYLKLFRFL